MEPITRALNLVVLRSFDIERAVAFYSKLGLEFTRHRHGAGVEHYSAELADLVFELYPQSGDGPSSIGTRIGFSVTSVDEAFQALADYPMVVMSGPIDYVWGRLDIEVDLAGNRIQ